MIDGDHTIIYLVSQRKNWGHDLPEGWVEVCFYRGEYIECGTFKKLTKDLNATDKEWVDDNGEIPSEWIF